MLGICSHLRKLTINASSNSICSNFLNPVQSHQLILSAGFKWKPPRTTGRSTNYHRSNRAKEGLFHGKDIRFGNSISHSHSRSKRTWQPNVQNKRLWSDALNDWVRFKITTAGIKAVDDCGGIDNYLLALDERLVADSNYITKMRAIISSTLFQRGELKEKYVKYLRYDKFPPPRPELLKGKIDFESF